MGALVGVWGPVWGRGSTGAAPLSSGCPFGLVEVIGRGCGLLGSPWG